jgi:hypothetical protein
MSPSEFTRIAVVAALLVVAANLPARAQSPPRPDPPPSAASVIGPGIRDKGGVYSEQERTRIATAIADLYKRYRCYVLIETCEGVPEGAGDIDLRDVAAMYHALGVWRDNLIEQAGRRDAAFSMILVQSKHQNRFCYWMGYGIFSKEEGTEIDHEMIHQIRGGMPNALSYLGRVVGRKRARLAKDGSSAPVQPRSPRDTPKPAPVAKVEDPKADFRRAAMNGGLVGPDLEAVEQARGGVTYEVLTGFVGEQIKEGRKGRDLKEDLLTFLTLLKGKKRAAGIP